MDISIHVPKFKKKSQAFIDFIWMLVSDITGDCLLIIILSSVTLEVYTATYYSLSYQVSYFVIFT